MTQLRKMMLEELVRRNYAQTTIDCYVQTVAHFSCYFHRPPDQLGPEHIRQYQAALFTEFKLAPNTVNQRLAALRFFYIKTLKKGWSTADTPYPRKVLNLPMVLSLLHSCGHCSVINGSSTANHPSEVPNMF